MSYAGLKRGGKETARFYLLPESFEELPRTAGFLFDVVGSPDVQEPVAAASGEYARDWATRLGLDHLRIEGIPLPSFVSLQFRFRLNFLFLLMEFSRRVVAAERPEKVVLSGLFPPERLVLRHVFEFLGVEVEETPGAAERGFHENVFRMGFRIRRIGEITIPRYRKILRRIIRRSRVLTPREDPRILAADYHCLTPEAIGYLRERGILLRVLDNDRGAKNILRMEGHPFRVVRLRGVPPAGWPGRGETRFPEEGTSRFSYRGIPFFPLIEGDLRAAVEVTAPRLFSYRSLPGEGLRKIVLREQNGPDGKMLVWLARQAGISTVMMQHGLMVGEHGYLPMEADVFVAWGREGQRWMEAKGVAGEKIRVIGSPRFDGYGKGRREEEDAGFGKTVLLVFESTEYNGGDCPLDNYRLLRLVLDAIIPLAGWRVVIRFHPAQTLEEREACRRLVRPFRSRIRVGREAGLAPSLSRADVVVTEASTVGIEALLQGKLLLVVRAKGYEGNPYLETDGLPRANTSEEIRAWLIKWEGSAAERKTSRDRAKRFLDGHLLRGEEEASVRFWKYCLS